MTSCYCDTGPAASFYVETQRKARKEHSCYECGRPIKKGETYSDLRAAWDGEPPQTIRTCPDCIAIREELEHMDCFCWSHGSLLDDITLKFQEADFTPGERFIYLRTLAKHRKRLKLSV